MKKHGTNDHVGQKNVRLLIHGGKPKLEES
jgi:hypothetical protein